MTDLNKEPAAGATERSKEFEPVVFIREGAALRKATSFPNIKGEKADILIVCGQGVYQDGIYYGEFHDRDVYFEHAIRTGEIISRFNYNCVVFSGGFTQERAPWRSEAESFIDMINDADAGQKFPAVPYLLDEAALDSAGNLLFGLMTARLSIGDTPIRRVGIWAAWKFKKWRFNRNAQALGIVERTYCHGLASAPQTNVEVPPEEQGQKTLKDYLQDEVEYHLLRQPEKKLKRQHRWQNNRSDVDRNTSLPSQDIRRLGNPGLWKKINQPRVPADPAPSMTYDGRVVSKYSNRASHLQVFQETIASLDRIDDGMSVEGSGLTKAFNSEVMM